MALHQSSVQIRHNEKIIYTSKTVIAEHTVFSTHKTYYKKTSADWYVRPTDVSVLDGVETDSDLDRLLLFFLIFF